MKVLLIAALLICSTYSFKIEEYLEQQAQVIKQFEQELVKEVTIVKEQLTEQVLDQLRTVNDVKPILQVPQRRNHTGPRNHNNTNHTIPHNHNNTNRTNQNKFRNIRENVADQQLNQLENGHSLCHKLNQTQCQVFQDLCAWDNVSQHCLFIKEFNQNDSDAIPFKVHCHGFNQTDCQNNVDLCYWDEFQTQCFHLNETVFGLVYNQPQQFVNVHCHGFNQNDCENNVDFCQWDVNQTRCLHINETQVNLQESGVLLFYQPQTYSFNCSNLDFYNCYYYYNSSCNWNNRKNRCEQRNNNNRTNNSFSLDLTLDQQNVKNCSILSYQNCSYQNLTCTWNFWYNRCDQRNDTNQNCTQLGYDSCQRQNTTCNWNNWFNRCEFKNNTRINCTTFDYSNCNYNSQFCQWNSYYYQCQNRALEEYIIQQVFDQITLQYVNLEQKLTLTTALE